MPVPVIVAGDFNAKDTTWSSPTNDRRGDSLAEMALALDLTVCNSGQTPTRKKDGHQSFIDVTLVSAEVLARVTNWAVLLAESLSDHNYIM